MIALIINFFTIYIIRFWSLWIKYYWFSCSCSYYKVFTNSFYYKSIAKQDYSTSLSVSLLEGEANEDYDSSQEIIMQTNAPQIENQGSLKELEVQVENLHQKILQIQKE